MRKVVVPDALDRATRNATGRIAPEIVIIARVIAPQVSNHRLRPVSRDERSCPGKLALVAVRSAFPPGLGFQIRPVITFRTLVVVSTPAGDVKPPPGGVSPNASFSDPPSDSPDVHVDCIPYEPLSPTPAVRLNGPVFSK